MTDADKNKLAKPREDKIVRGSVKTKGEGALHKFADVFLAEDIENVKSYITMDVLIPAAKKLILDIITGGAEMLLNGRIGHGKTGTNASYVSYRDYPKYESDRYSSGPKMARTGYGFNDVIFETRGDAEAVLMRMEESIRKYGFVSVLDLYDLAGLPTTPSDNNYGWLSLRNARIQRVRDGYMLELPKALPRD